MRTFLALLALTLAIVSGAAEKNVKLPDGADLVVIGNVYTSEKENLTAEAFVVDKGRYVYVGDAKTAEKYIKKGKTLVIKQTDGMIMPGCTEGHGHYITEAVFKKLCYLKSEKFDDCIAEIHRYYEANKNHLTQLFGYGWFEANVEDDLGRIRAALDSITTEIPIFICDREMHQGWVNSKALEMAGLKDDPTKSESDGESIPGGTVYRDKNGVLLGRVQDQACGFLRRKAFGALLDVNGYAAAAADAQHTLHGFGYTNYLDAWLSYDNTDIAYKCLNYMDSQKTLNMNIVGCYEIDSYRVGGAADYENIVAEAVDWQNRYTSTHFHPNTVKLFADGCSESYQGYVLKPYPYTNTTGTCNWNHDLFADVVKYINDKGLLVHTHCYGDAAVQYVVDGYEASYNSGNRMRNSLGHAANVTDRDMERLAKYGLGVAENFCWHTISSSEEPVEVLHEKLGTDLFESMYPMKRFFEHGIPVSSSTDAPCSVGYPSDPFGIMEIMLTGINPDDVMPARNPAECTSRDEAMEAMTINGAWMLGLENERGSIKVGKYADFILIDNDLRTCPANQFHQTHVIATYFEGKCVYEP